jgi:proteasome lid subunit RPN8/RPN11
MKLYESHKYWKRLPKEQANQQPFFMVQPRRNNKNSITHPLAKQQKATAVKGKEVNNPYYIKKHVFNQMVQHCKQQYPLEACGLLSGKNGLGESFWMMENINRNPNSFAMDMEQLKQVFQSMSGKGEELTAIFHSHPTTAPYPSQKDIKFAHYPEAAYIIVSLTRQRSHVKCFYIEKWHVCERNLEIVND